MLQGSSRAAALAAVLAVAAPRAVAAAGDAAAGRALFIGARPLEKGGAPCGACHAFGGQGPAFAASLGPDLTTTFVGVPLEEVDAVLEASPFPTMAPVYAGRAPTAGERADLAAFLVREGGKGAPPGGGPVAGWAALVLLACLAALGAAARRRGGSVRAGLVARAPRVKGEAR